MKKLMFLRRKWWFYKLEQKIKDLPLKARFYFYIARSAVLTALFLIPVTVLGLIAKLTDKK